ncbi:hypothetical protein [Streptomyces mirabilis]|uniref:hypothetical protein n=1 Tax=Streptomyces mirabilis TaxID=68239 RepID=UPI0022596C1C|nr:hypothetical protein [Streptomyces mirabilis]MCX4615730.1 hypothetical protein [Streptomyces mirabilis]
MPHTARRTTADDLQVVVDHWTHMRDLIDTSQTSGTWPAAMGKGEYLHEVDRTRSELELAIEHAQHLITKHDEHGRVQYECVHCDYVGEGGAHTPRADREPGQLGERPVPIRLHVVDACRAVEVALCSLADLIAAEVQLAPLTPMPAVKHTGYGTRREAQIAAADRARRGELAAEDVASPYRWSFTMGDRSAVRAAEWLLARFNGETEHCKPISSLHRAHITVVAREAARRIERTIGGLGARYSVPMDDRPCPYCGSSLTLHRGGGLDDVVVCAGPDCEAPVGLDGGRRTWSTPEQLAALQVALDAAAQRRKRADARRRQRAARRAAA